MRKYMVLTVAFAFLLFALGAMAQAAAPGTSGATTNMDSSTDSSQNPNSPAGDEVQPPSNPAYGDPAPSAQETAMAQSDSSSQGQAGGSSSSGSMGTGMQGQAPSGSSGNASVEGCIVQEETDYYLIPKSGNPIHLTPSANANPSAHVGHHVTATGTETATSGGSSASGGGSSLSSSATQDMTVAEIDMVSESCPSNWNSQYSGAGAKPSK
jgi:hypothetical protein